MKPRLLDLFCGAGGCAVGYHRAGFEVVGVDINPQPRYPFECHQADAMTFPLDGFDVIHASPPCQKFSTASRLNKKTYTDLLTPIRERLAECNAEWVIENVPGAPMPDAVVVCGLALGLNVKRHRLFEASRFLFGTTCPKGHPGDWLTVCGDGGRLPNTPSSDGIIRRHGSPAKCRDAMGIDWMTRKELSQAIPPAYTEFIGKQLIQRLETAAA